MAWVAIKRNGQECICSIKPDIWCVSDEDYGIIELPKGSIKKLICRDLTWNDEPVKLEEN